MATSAIRSEWIKSRTGNNVTQMHYARRGVVTEEAAWIAEVLDAWARGAGLLLKETRGMAYNPVLRRAWLSRSQAVNYIAWFQK